MEDNDTYLFAKPQDTSHLFVMLGFLGSGKSYVSKWLAPHVGAVYLRADALRLAMFGEDRPELYRPENKALVNNANRYAITQILQSNVASVIYDANNGITREQRRSFEALAAADGAKLIVVWIDTPLDIAKQRTVTREATEGHKLFAPNLVEKMAADLEAPTADEWAIRIDGLLTPEEQRAQFDEQFARLRAQALQ